MVRSDIPICWIGDGGMSEEVPKTTSKWKPIQKIVVVVLLVWAAFTYVKNIVGPSDDFVINSEQYIIPEGCSINDVYQKYQIEKIIRSGKKYVNISRKCLSEKYKISSDDSEKFNFHYVKSFGRNYFRIGNGAVNVQCKNDICQELGRHSHVFDDSQSGIEK
jgi:hypothetical protein